MMAAIAAGVALLTLACLSACAAVIAYAAAVKIVDSCLDLIGLK